MASYSVNDRAVRQAQRLIDARQYVLDSDWGEVQPRAAAQNAFLESHTWDEYAEWHLWLTDGAAEHTKARHAFVYGDFRRVHRTGLTGHKNSDLIGDAAWLEAARAKLRDDPPCQDSVPVTAGGIASRPFAPTGTTGEPLKQQAKRLAQVTVDHQPLSPDD